MKPQGRRRLVSFFQEAFGLSRRTACGLAQISRSVVEYRSRRTDTLADGRTFRTLNVVDDFTREARAIEVGRSIPGQRVVRVLERITKARPLEIRRPRLVRLSVTSAAAPGCFHFICRRFFRSFPWRSRIAFTVLHAGQRGCHLAST